MMSICQVGDDVPSAMELVTSFALENMIPFEWKANMSLVEEPAAVEVNSSNSIPSLPAARYYIMRHFDKPVDS